MKKKRSGWQNSTMVSAMQHSATTEAGREVKWDLGLLPVLGKEGESQSQKARLPEFIHIPVQCVTKWEADYVILRETEVENWLSYAFERLEWKTQHA